jgi:hypothetical protein
MGSSRRFAICLLVLLSFGSPAFAQEAEEHAHASPGSEEGLGHAHMEISCSPVVAAKFDRALALLQNTAVPPTAADSSWITSNSEGIRHLPSCRPPGSYCHRGSNEPAERGRFCR